MVYLSVMKNRRKRFSLLIAGGIFVVLVFLFGSVTGYFYGPKIKSRQKEVGQKDIFLAFFNEVYDKILENYWEKLSEEQLINLYILGTEKLTGQPHVLEKVDKQHFEELIVEINQRLETEEKKKELVTKLTDIVLANLKPSARSRLYTQKQERDLSNQVANVAEVDQYQILEVEKEASQEEIEAAYRVKKKTPEVERAYQTLSDQESRRLYDLSGVEPTIEYDLIRPDILHLHLTKISPTTLDDLKRVTEKFTNRPGLDTLILDLQDNIGGSVDLLPHLLGPFIGQDQYAYQFFHQGEKTDYKTRTGWLPSLVPYKKVVILVNENTQSSAEVMAAVLKKYNVGVVVGTKTKGWGTIEKVFPLENQLDENEKYSLFLVHSLTLGDDSQPIESRGVLPLINIEDPDWQAQLYSHFHYQDLIEAVERALAS